MIQRIWHGWTTPSNAEAYGRLLDEEIVPAITARAIPGHRSTTVLRSHEVDTPEVEFVTLMAFDGWDAVKAFAGGDGRGSVVQPAARALLRRFDEHSQHYEVVAEHPGGSHGPA
jgi:antibiotic biosynthesis monooxygenase (ABM) superfamily enzyme